MFHEGFPDRGYAADGRLLPRVRARARWSRTEAGSSAQALALAASVDSVCLHGDSPGAVASAVAVRSALEAAG